MFAATASNDAAVKRDYREGDWFGVPLGDGRTAAGIIAAGTRNVLSGYFFSGPEGTPSRAILACRFYDEALHEERWPVLRAQPRFDPAEWPKLDGNAYEARRVEASVASRLAGLPAARPRAIVWDVRSPVDPVRFDALAAGARVRLQWRSPLDGGALTAVREACARLPDASVRLYGQAMAQLTEVSAWPQVRAIAADGAGFDGVPFAHVRALALDGVPASLASIAERVPELRNLRIDARGATLRLGELANVARLESLEIVNAQCEGAASLASLSSLRSLHVGDATVDDPNAIFALETIETLRLASVSEIRSIDALRGRDRLRTLALENLTHVDDVAALASLPLLESLTLTGMWQLHPAGVAFVAELPQLHRLDIDIGGRRKNLEIYRRRPFAYPLPFETLL